MKSGIFLIFVFFLLSGMGCSPPTVKLADPSESTGPVSPPHAEEFLEESQERRLKQVDCQSIGEGACGKNCKKICNNLFPRSQQENCYLLKKDLVKEFENIITDVEKGETDKLDQPALYCLLDLDSGSFIQSIKAMSAGEAKGFLKEIAKDSDLADMLQSADKQLKIIKQLLREASKSSDLVEGLNTVVDTGEGQSFLWLSADKQNKPAWAWLESYVKNYCKKSSKTCVGFNQIGSIGVHCQALLKEKNLSGFLSSADLFKEKYKKRVERAGYEYKITNHDYIWHESLKGDFRDFCRIETEITEGERKLRSNESQKKYFNSTLCKQNMKPAGFVDADGNGVVDSADTDRIWALKNCADDAPYKCLIDSNHVDYFTGYFDNEYVWDYGNVYGDVKGAFGLERLKGVGQQFWYLDEDNKIINPFINDHFNIFIKRGYTEAPKELLEASTELFDDPKNQKVRRASFMYYIPQELTKDYYPDCTKGTADRTTCPYFYCLVDYELNVDNSVKTCDVIKCALGRPDLQDEEQCLAVDL